MDLHPYDTERHDTTRHNILNMFQLHMKWNNIIIKKL
jgi:hypothetical protein